MMGQEMMHGGTMMWGMGLIGLLTLVALVNPGNWMLHCHVMEHQVDGLMTIIRVA